MTDEQRADVKKWVDTWKRAGPLLEAQREEDVRHSDTMGAFSFFAGMPLFNLRTSPPEPTSGLVEQQQWFRKIARE